MLCIYIADYETIYVWDVCKIIGNYGDTEVLDKWIIGWERLYDYIISVCKIV